jgi:predicted DNA binding CopG/RHH family protein
MKRKPRGKFDPTKLVYEGIVELPEDQHRMAVFQTKIADEECRVNFRWGLAQVSVVKQVADLMGVSYQQYIKQVLYRQAHADLQQFGAPNSANKTEPSRKQK